MVSSDDLTIKKPRTSHPRRPKECVRSKATKSSSSTPHEDLTKEGSRYVHNAIAKIVSRILDEQHQVPGISVPLNSIIPDPPKDFGVNQDGSTLKETEDVSEDDDNVPDHVPDNVPDKVNNTDAEGCDGDVGNVGGGTGASGTSVIECVVEVDNMSDDERITSVSPSIATRLVTRRKGKGVMHSYPKKKIVVNSLVKKKNMVGSPVKRKAVPKSTTCGPTKPWSKVMPKKRKVVFLNETDYDVPSNVPDIPRMKKPSFSKLAASVPDVPIDNISFHLPSNVNRWKYVFQKKVGPRKGTCKECVGV
ncbi:uncharacterized protein LOC131658585 [Vicia villosa]|uniref:uncharacterized protein LOC131658585 n=1 Tax=Vicia villosa TaxID=3911 RepID=UPI00273BB754|nr:uncharacterized protein LOC131658585 [Vicia villosa]